jgi:hypothetical protein
MAAKDLRSASFSGAHAERIVSPENFRFFLLVIQAETLPSPETAHKRERYENDVFDRRYLVGALPVTPWDFQASSKLLHWTILIGRSWDLIRPKPWFGCNASLRVESGVGRMRLDL